METYKKWRLKVHSDKTKYLIAGGTAKPLDINNKNYRFMLNF